jgi:competence protein ComEC
MSKSFLIRRKTIITSLMIFFISLGIGYWQGLESKNLRVWFADVGQGDGIIIRTPSHDNLIIDGGPGLDFISKVDAKLPIIDRDIDLLVATHPDSDHITGLVALLNSNRVKRVLITDAVGTSSIYKSFANLIETKHIPVVKAESGEVFVFGEVITKVLWPPKGYQFNSKDLNQSSIVLEMSYGQEDFLFTGDAPEDVENNLVGTKTIGQVEVLKVSHHGSKSASGESFLKTVNPQYAIISAGLNNKYGHPAPLIVNRLQVLGVAIYRTDYQGDILVESSKSNLYIKTQK